MQYYFPKFPDISLNETLGIDFGTTNTTVFVASKDHAEAVEVDGTNRLLRSVVSFQKDKELVGKVAVNNVRRSILTVENIKRIMGLSYQEASKFDESCFGCRIVDNAGSVLLKPSNGRNEEFSKRPEDVLIILFNHIKVQMEERFQSKFNYLVLTVPSTYTSNQKGSIRAAATQAGFNVISMITEPTAAGIHYRNLDLVESDSVCLVFDFGGGTLDLSLVNCQRNSFMVLSNGGSPHLGGNDIDKLLLDWVKKKHHGDTQSEWEIRRAMLRNLLKSIEDTKILIQENGTGEIPVDDTLITLSLSGFNDIIKPIIDEAIQCIKEVGADVQRRYSGKRINGYYISDDELAEDIIVNLVDRVLLVGGSSKLNIIKKRLNEFFGREITYIDDDSQLCVGSGAMESVMYIAKDNQIHECLYNSYVISVNGTDPHVLPRGTMIPFSVTYVIGEKRGRYRLDITVKEERPNQEGRIVLEYSDRCFADLQIVFLTLLVEIQYDGLLTIRVKDERTGRLCELGEFEY